MVLILWLYQWKQTTFVVDSDFAFKKARATYLLGCSSGFASVPIIRRERFVGSDSFVFDKLKPPHMSGKILVAQAGRLFRLLGPSDIPALDLAALSFVDEPMMRSRGATVTDWRTVLGHFDDCLKNGYSVAAVDKVSGEMQGRTTILIPSMRIQQAIFETD